MNDPHIKKDLICLWIAKARDALSSAKIELREGHASFAVNRLYYCCFYAITALLTREDKQYSKHSAVMAEFNRSFIKTGKIDTEWSYFYQKLFDDRQESDYLPTTSFDTQDITARIERAEQFISIIQGMVSP